MDGSGTGFWQLQLVTSWRTFYCGEPIIADWLWHSYATLGKNRERWLLVVDLFWCFLSGDWHPSFRCAIELLLCVLWLNMSSQWGSSWGLVWSGSSSASFVPGLFFMEGMSLSTRPLSQLALIRRAPLGCWQLLLNRFIFTISIL